MTATAAETKKISITNLSPCEQQPDNSVFVLFHWLCDLFLILIISEVGTFISEISGKHKVEIAMHQNFTLKSVITVLV